MSTLAAIVERTTDFDADDLNWLHHLIADWHVIADLAFADLILCVPGRDGSLTVGAHVRSASGPTVHQDDVVGRGISPELLPLLDEAITTRKIVRSEQTRWIGGTAVREEAVPVVSGDRILSVLVRQTNLGAVRTPSLLELNYVEAADELCEMIVRGEFPFPPAPGSTRRGAPRVGDGFMRLTADGEVMYASPNALSCFHRLGIHGPIVGKYLLDELSVLRSQNLGGDEATPIVLKGRASWRTELELRGVCVAARSIPLLEDGERIGAILLCRDVSELRRRERELVTKDATIREINHRVKNNLQTVSALLRMQARRMSTSEARGALEEAQRRVTTIAMVHEALSSMVDETVPFDELIRRIVRMIADVTSTGGKVHTMFTGTFGMVSAQDATPLALIITELVSNAVEHGIGSGSGNVEVIAKRSGIDLTLEVVDDGVGMPAGAQPEGLGTSIIKTLVENELGGHISWTSSDSGTRVRLEMRLTR